MTTASDPGAYLTPERRCTGCKRKLPVIDPTTGFANFFRDKSRPGGYSPRCKDCHSVRDPRRHRASYRRAGEYGVPRELYLESDIVQRDNGMCYLCMQPVPEDEQSFDHIIPLQKPNTPGDVPENVRLTHKACNLEKGERTFEEYMAYKAQMRIVGQRAQEVSKKTYGSHGPPKQQKRS